MQPEHSSDLTTECFITPCVTVYVPVSDVEVTALLEVEQSRFAASDMPINDLIVLKLLCPEQSADLRLTSNPAARALIHAATRRALMQMLSIRGRLRE